MKFEVRKIGKNTYKKRRCLDVDDVLTVLIIGVAVFVIVLGVLLV